MTTVFVTLHCDSPYCWGERVVVGEIPPGGIARLKCPRCHEIRVYRTPMFAGILDSGSRVSIE